MERSISREHYYKRKRQMRRRRIFWSLLFILIAAVAAYKAVGFVKDKLDVKTEDTSDTIIVNSEQTQGDGAAAGESTNASTTQTETTDANGQSQGQSNTLSDASKSTTVSTTDFIVKNNDAWQYILVNKMNAVDENFAPPETYLLQKQYKSDARIKEATLAMFNAAEADGVRLIACSAYRTYDYQQKLFDKMKAKFSNLSDEEAAKEAAKIVAKPGTSEHQTGLALDIVTPTYTSLDEGYAETKAGKWLAANAHTYGFILRYPKDKTEITQIIFEPWHYRYVGKEAAKIIFEEGLCYEEFYERIQFQE